MADGPLWLIEINIPVLARMGFGAGGDIQMVSNGHFECWLIPKFPYSTGIDPSPRPMSAGEEFRDARFYNLIVMPWVLHRPSDAHACIR